MKTGPIQMQTAGPVLIQYQLLILVEVQKTNATRYVHKSGRENCRQTRVGWLKLTNLPLLYLCKLQK